MSRWWDDLVGPPREGGGSGDEADHGWANQLFQEEHKAKLNHTIRMYASLGTVTIDQTDNLHEIIRQHAQPDADKLHSVSPTRANFRYVQPSHWNIDKIKHITFTADRPHGFGHGRAGKVEVLNDTQVRIHR